MTTTTLAPANGAAEIMPRLEARFAAVVPTSVLLEWTP